jgi:hypothetical protein
MQITVDAQLPIKVPKKSLRQFARNGTLKIYSQVYRNAAK